MADGCCVDLGRGQEVWAVPPEYTTMYRLLSTVKYTNTGVCATG